MSLHSTLDSSLGCLKEDSQKADNAAFPSHMWDHFFRTSFLQKFGIGERPVSDWRPGHVNVYRRHNPRRWKDLPDGWEGALGSFRCIGMRW